MNFKFIPAIIAIALVSSCKKDKTPPVTPTPPATKYLTVILNPDYLPLAKIDSAYITWENGTATDSAKLTPRNNDLAITFDKLPSTEKKYQLHLFTTQQLSFRKLLWQKEFTVALSQKETLNIEAPLTLNDVNWKPRIILKDGAGLQVFSGIRPGDAYFRIHKIDKSWKDIVMDRSYWNTIGPDTKVAGAIWRGINTLDETGSYSNDTFFSLLPAQIGNSSWNHIEIILLFTDKDNTQTRILDFTHSFDN